MPIEARRARALVTMLCAVGVGFEGWQGDEGHIGDSKGGVVALEAQGI